jgi:hypothetical protein
VRSLDQRQKPDLSQVKQALINQAFFEQAFVKQALRT